MPDSSGLAARRAAGAISAGVCPNCVSYLALYSQTVKMGKRAYDDEQEAVPTDMPEELVKAIMEARRRR